jgi:uncharacterized LabA/DUF88 family protein
MKRYAFVDVQNTASTTELMLGFVLDLGKLADFLKNKKSCSEVFFYSGIDQGDVQTASEFDALNKTGCCTVRSKAVFAYKNRDKIIALKCSVCGNDIIHTVNMGYTKKSNCDVELSVDAIERAGPDVELYLFTGDGDFEYLIRKALERGVSKVYVVSYAGKETKAGLTLARFSTKLKDLIAEQQGKVFYMSLADIKNNIKKDIPATI